MTTDVASTSNGAPAQAPGVFTPEGAIGKLVRVQAFQILLVLVVIFLIFSALAPTIFPQWSNLRLIIQNMSILAILGIGMTFVIVTSGIDLSIGSVLVFSGVVSAMAMRAVGGDGLPTAGLGILVAVGCGLAWGILNGVLVAKAKVPPLIVTLGTLGGALGLSQVLTGGVDIRDVPSILSDNIGYGNVPGTTLPLISLIAFVFLVAFGIILVYSISGGLAGVAGILSLSQYGTTAIAGQSQTNLNVIAAVVIGGTSLFGGVGTIFGTVVGLFIPAVLQNGFVIVGVQPFWQQVAVGFVLIIAVYIDQRRRLAAARGTGVKRRFSLGNLVTRRK
jgi:ribose transport system permease protein